MDSTTYSLTWSKLSLLIICAFLRESTTLSYPLYSEPTYKTISEMHGYIQLASIPPGMNPTATYIYLKGNQLTVVNNSAFSNFSNLMQLDLNTNAIVTVEDVSFAGTQIEYLSINSNDIPGVIPDVCVLNATLKVMDFSYNQLTSVPDARLACLTELLVIVLDSNYITVIPNVHTLPNYDNLVILKISSNPLTIAIPMDLYNMTALEGLGLNLMNMASFPDLSQLPTGNALNTIHMTSNPVATVTNQALAALAGTPLKTLYMTEYGDMFVRLAPSMSSLTYLYCYYSDVTDMTIPYLPLLKSVSIRYSSLASFPNVLELNATLTTLEIQDCTNFNSTVDEMMTNLEVLSLEYLKLVGNAHTTLNDLTPILPNLRDVHLSRNPWHCDCNLKWMYTMIPTITDFNHMTCNSPPELYGVKFTDLDPDNFTCPEGER